MSVLPVYDTDTAEIARRLDRLPDVVAELAAAAAQHDLDGSYPIEGIAAVHRAGLLTATVATRYGGPGAGVSDAVTILRELGRGDPSVALIVALTLITHGVQARSGRWPDPLYRRLLDAVDDRPPLVNELRVEPELGTPSRGGLPATVARRTEAGWLLSGRKIYSTGSDGLRWMLVFAATEDGETGTFVVDGDSPGISIERTWDHLGLRASASHDVIFADTPVPADSVLELGGASGSVRASGHQVWNNLGLAALYLGVAGAARDWFLTFLKERVPGSLGKPLATLPRFHAVVGEIEAGLLGADELLTSLAARADAGEELAPSRVGAAKLVANHAAIEAVERAVAAIGNPALTRHNPLQRHLRDVLCARVHFPQDDVILSMLGRETLGQ